MKKAILKKNKKVYPIRFSIKKYKRIKSLKSNSWKNFCYKSKFFKEIYKNNQINFVKGLDFPQSNLSTKIITNWLKSQIKRKRKLGSNKTISSEKSQNLQSITAKKVLKENKKAKKNFDNILNVNFNDQEFAFIDVMDNDREKNEFFEDFLHQKYDSQKNLINLNSIDSYFAEEANEYMTIQDVFDKRQILPPKEIYENESSN